MSTTFTKQNTQANCLLLLKNRDKYNFIYNNNNTNTSKAQNNVAALGF